MSHNLDHADVDENVDDVDDDGENDDRDDGDHHDDNDDGGEDGHDDDENDGDGATYERANQNQKTTGIRNLCPFLSKCQDDERRYVPIELDAD